MSVLHQLHDDDPEGGYRVLADDIAEQVHGGVAGSGSPRLTLERERP